ncbi:MAG: hypothetical protein A2Y24_02975 [Clostridiales bacterium GWE2_32_10]|nr:MAG: hypothetical protein A2Y24_02975 [Clostridiales bacterium GWE2_32_10]HBY19540.1 hypothetical protein [Clostridiales bacterium]
MDMSKKIILLAMIILLILITAVLIFSSRHNNSQQNSNKVVDSKIEKPPVEYLEIGDDKPAIEESVFDLEKFKTYINDKNVEGIVSFFAPNTFDVEKIKVDFTFDGKKLLIVEKNEQEESYRQVRLKLLSESEYKEGKIKIMIFINMKVDSNTGKITKYSIEKTNNQ